jgi:hypothetical protein
MKTGPDCEWGSKTEAASRDRADLPLYSYSQFIVKFSLTADLSFYISF